MKKQMSFICKKLFKEKDMAEENICKECYKEIYKDGKTRRNT